MISAMESNEKQSNGREILSVGRMAVVKGKFRVAFIKEKRSEQIFEGE